MSSEFDDLNSEQMRDLARACGLVNGRTDPIVIPRARSMRTRMRYARAAFVGDVRVPLLVFIVLLGMFFSGWFVAQKYYLDLVYARANEVRAETRLKTRLEAEFRHSKILSRVRESFEENEAYLEFIDEMYVEMEKARKEIDAELAAQGYQ